MKRILLLFATMLTVLQLMAGEPISLKDITNGAFATKRISGVNPLKGTSEYAQISSDGRQVVKYSFKTGSSTGVIFDLADAKGEQLKSFDDYQISSDGIDCYYKRIQIVSIVVRLQQTFISMM